jgi:hypothetical protein
VIFWRLSFSRVGSLPNMTIIGCDYHPGFQQIAFVVPKVGNCKSAGCSTERMRKSFIVTSRHGG